MGSKFLPSILVLTTVFSCTLFSPREAEPPAGSDFWIEPFSPGIAVANFSKSVEKKSSANYARCLDGDFFFAPYYPDTFGSAGLFENWGKQKEKEYIEIVFSGTPSPLLILTPVQRDSTDSLAQFYYNYEFYADSPASGLLLITLVPDISGVWFIKNIDDLGGDEPTWTFRRKGLYERFICSY
ncbi:hypothetical protein JW890_03365 [candidate division WOR-3 bacterium]|nr:hypothetical protein [candidate division WOR-3 bacterium]